MPIPVKGCADMPVMKNSCVPLERSGFAIVPKDLQAIQVGFTNVRKNLHTNSFVFPNIQERYIGLFSMRKWPPKIGVE